MSSWLDWACLVMSCLQQEDEIEELRIQFERREMRDCLIACQSVRENPIEFKDHVQQESLKRSEEEHRAYWADEGISVDTVYESWELIVREVTFYLTSTSLVLSPTLTQTHNLTLQVYIFIYL